MSDVELGCRSPLVLAKLGFDLRSCYQETIEAPMPDRLRALCDELMGFVQFDEIADDDGADGRH